MIKKKTKKAEPIIEEKDLDVFEHFRKIVKKIQDDLDLQYKANMEERKTLELQSRILRRESRKSNVRSPKNWKRNMSCWNASNRMKFNSRWD